MKELVEDGLLEKVCYSESSARYEYHLTAAGRDLRPGLQALVEWGSNHFSPKGRQMQLMETATQRPVTPQMVDSENGQPLTSDKYQMVTGPAASPVMHYRQQYLQESIPVIPRRNLRRSRCQRIHHDPDPQKIGAAAGADRLRLLLVAHRVFYAFHLMMPNVGADISAKYRVTFTLWRCRTTRR